MDSPFIDMLLLPVAFVILTAVLTQVGRQVVLKAASLRPRRSLRRFSLRRAC